MRTRERLTNFRAVASLSQFIHRMQEVGAQFGQANVGDGSGVPSRGLRKRLFDSRLSLASVEPSLNDCCF
jgi:hypothetical protein